MNREDLLNAYCAYIECLNGRDWSRLGDQVAEGVARNG